MDVQSFINYLSFEKRYSAHTITSYQNDLNQFFGYLEKIYRLTDIGIISHFHIRSWMVELMDIGVSPRSINRKLSSLKSFFKYLLRQERIKVNPMNKIVAPKAGKRLPSYIRESEMSKLSELKANSDYSTYRDYLIMHILYYTGIRRSELINLKDKDINLSGGIKVLGKGNKERIIPVLPDLMKEIKEYQIIRNNSFEGKSEFLLLTDKGVKLYPKFVYNTVKRYLSLVTTSQKKSPHILRHSFATHLSNRGAELKAIKELLGHANLSATQIYMHNSVDKLKETYNSAHPKA